MTFLTEIKQTILPDRDSAYGPLPPMLLGLTVVSGLVDAFSYLVLGHVFVANMTGNVVFLAFALIGARGFSIPASIAGSGLIRPRRFDRRSGVCPAGPDTEPAY